MITFPNFCAFSPFFHADRIAATLQLLTFFFIAVFAFDPQDYYCIGDRALENYKWPTNTDNRTNENLNKDIEAYCPSFFQLPVLMLMLITLLNDGTLISVGYDYVKPSPRPEKWNLKVLFLVSSILGVVSMGSSLLLLWAALDSPNEGSLFKKLGLPVPAYGQIVTMIYLKVSLSDFLTLFAARTSPGPFWSAAPAPILVGAASIALALSTVLSCVWLSGEMLPSCI
jgi:H+-transporting ATPase